uniref:G domain-containing protein n=1 Tax=Echinostoma caproni TaxID=27848 RepID=A0A183BFL3_9TREM
LSEYLQKLLMLHPHPPPDARTLKVAVIGCPNAGKSSLVNMLTKWRVCAVSGKAHTTRSKQMAAITKDNVQIVSSGLPLSAVCENGGRFCASAIFLLLKVYYYCLMEYNKFFCDRRKNGYPDLTRASSHPSEVYHRSAASSVYVYRLTEKLVVTWPSSVAKF